MPVRPALPNAYPLPSAVNGWRYNSDATRNAHVWTAVSAPKSVAMFAHLNRVSVQVFDDRVSGFKNRVTIYEQEKPEDQDETQAVVRGVEQAISWMTCYGPADWEHPDVNEAVFVPPVGYALDLYYLEQREIIIYYHREGAAETDQVAGINGSEDDDPTPSTYPYLVVKVWRGSGNATIALAPWRYAHDHELYEVREPPAECGLSIALKLAREYAEDATGKSRDTPAAGQADLSAWSP